MPRVKLGIPAEQLALEQELRDRYGGMMGTRDVQEELGVGSYNTAASFLEGVSFIKVGKLKKYRVADVAKRIYINMEC